MAARLALTALHALLLAAVAAGQVAAQTAPAAPAPAASAPAATAPAPAAAGEVEARTNDGRKVLLKPDGTWRYADGPEGQAPTAPVAPPGPLSLIELTARQPVSEGCRIQVDLFNRFNYEIRSFAPDLLVTRSGGMPYSELVLPFGQLKPGDRQSRQITVTGLTCGEVERIQVAGGDRCVMDNLTRFTEEKGSCLVRFEVAPSQLLKFEK